MPRRTPERQLLGGALGCSAQRNGRLGRKGLADAFGRNAVHLLAARQPKGITGASTCKREFGDEYTRLVLRRMNPARRCRQNSSMLTVPNRLCSTS